MKAERLQLLTTPAFKAFLGKEAKREGVNVAELVRSRCERRPSDDEARLAKLTVELRKKISDARSSLRGGLKEAHDVLAAFASQACQPRNDCGGTGMSVLNDAFDAVRDALELTDDVKRAGETLKGLSVELRAHDRRITRLEAKWETALELANVNRKRIE
ncbi:MAG: hypothetical protein COW59_09545 [Lysobacterales bacterium CG17_big_fil_post_rev_8_21_14_2_50_64_11]|nr:MAG: hypothetical protein COW59_09545 [Xanthomonadales bacterium CG17_big_fil_post_rev_8_21_14_2_50_64_11]PIX60200.1 MAG: hypothetical protein COZ47_08390 [Xanthomonadales bacterium CG_4_10_14_3_um_filter_64_11]